MTNPDLNEEIEEIGAHLKDMKQQRKSNKKQAESKVDAADETPPAEDNSDISDEELSALKAMLAEFDAEEMIDTVSTHAKAWLGTLNEDLKRTC